MSHGFSWASAALVARLGPTGKKVCLALADLKGKVVIVAAFQMNCPGSQKHGLPQAARMAGAFNSDEVAVIGLHSVFEDHATQKPEALEAFLAENEIEFPVAVDKPNGGGLPKTFEAYELQGTPTVLIFDRQGRLRRKASPSGSDATRPRGQPDCIGPHRAPT